MGPLTHLVLVLGTVGSKKTLQLQKIVDRNRLPDRVNVVRGLVSEGARFGCPFVVHDTMGYFLPRPLVTVCREGDAEDAARLAIKKALELGGCTLVLDEISLAWPPRNPPATSSALFEIIVCGRNPRARGPWRRRGPVSCVAAVQRPHDVSPIVRDLTDRFYVGHVDGEAELDWISKNLSPGIALTASRLPQGVFAIHYRS